MRKLNSPRFSPDGARIYTWAIADDGSKGVWWVPAAGGEATKVVAFDDPSLDAFIPAVGSDHLYFVVGHYESDIYVMDLEW